VQGEEYRPAEKFCIVFEGERFYVGFGRNTVRLLKVWRDVLWFQVLSQTKMDPKWGSACDEKTHLSYWIYR